MHASRVKTLKKRGDFLRIGAARISYGTTGFLLLAAPSSTSDVQVGYTVTKKIGNAVVRNRIKRRFRALSKAVMANHGDVAFDYVLIARPPAQGLPFEKLKEDLIFALQKIHKKAHATPTA